MKDALDPERRRALAQLGLTAAIAYTAPVATGLRRVRAWEGNGWTASSANQDGDEDCDEVTCTPVDDDPGWDDGDNGRGPPSDDEDGDDGRGPPSDDDNNGRGPPSDDNDDGRGPPDGRGGNGQGQG